MLEEEENCTQKKNGPILVFNNFVPRSMLLVRLREASQGQVSNAKYEKAAVSLSPQTISCLSLKLANNRDGS